MNQGLDVAIRTAPETQPVGALLDVQLVKPLTGRRCQGQSTSSSSVLRPCPEEPLDIHIRHLDRLSADLYFFLDALMLSINSRSKKIHHTAHRWGHRFGSVDVQRLGVEPAKSVTHNRRHRRCAGQVVVIRLGREQAGHIASDSTLASFADMPSTAWQRCAIPAKFYPCATANTVEPSG